MAFTRGELDRFSAGQQTQLNRISDARITAVGRVASDRTKWVTRLLTYTPAQLRARVNIASVQWASPHPTVVWAPESDYTTAEQGTITNGGIVAGDKPLFRAADLVP